jgi:hypothetical protein
MVNAAFSIETDGAARADDRKAATALLYVIIRCIA